MSTTKTPEEVGQSMTLYNFRPGSLRDALPRELTAGNIIHCFDKGRHRVLSRGLLNGAVASAEGFYITLRGRKIILGDPDANLGVRLPAGFVTVPVRTILRFYSTSYALNILKIERRLTEYHREFSQYLRERADGLDTHRPRRPTLSSLFLDTPTEFELFLRPLKSFYCERLKRAFDRLVIDAEDGNYTVFLRMNALFLPDVLGAIRTDGAAQLRWASAINGGVHKYIAVRIASFDSLSNEPPVVEFLNDGIPPFPPNAPPPAAAPPAPPLPPPPTPMELDEQLLERVRLNQTRKFRKLFLYMSPWEKAQRVSNPFVSPEYRQAFLVAQDGFARRFAEFKNKMNRKRAQHAAEWRNYTAYRNEMKSVFMLDTKRLPQNQFAERPQIEHFTQEWKDFIFGLKEEMKIYTFSPIRVPAPVAVGVAPAYVALAPQNGNFLNDPNQFGDSVYTANISSNIFQNTRRMFLI